jgi:hypothetical protein
MKYVITRGGHGLKAAAMKNVDHIIIDIPIQMA